MRVNSGGGGAGVPGERLGFVECAAVIDDVAEHCVTKHVRVNVAVETRSPDQGFEDLVDQSWPRARTGVWPGKSNEHEVAVGRAGYRVTLGEPIIEQPYHHWVARQFTGVPRFGCSAVGIESLDDVHVRTVVTTASTLAVHQVKIFQAQSRDLATAHSSANGQDDDQPVSGAAARAQQRNRLGFSCTLGSPCRREVFDGEDSSDIAA